MRVPRTCPGPPTIETTYDIGREDVYRTKPLPPSPTEETSHVPRGLFSMRGFGRDLVATAVRSSRESSRRRSLPPASRFDPQSVPSWRPLLSPPVYPADDLLSYLQYAQIPKWTRWIDPDLVRGDESRFGSHQTLFWSTRRGRTSDREAVASDGDLCGRQAVIHRLAESVTKTEEEDGWEERALRSWETRRGFYEMIESRTCPV
jgi:hypothetical protein